MRNERTIAVWLNPFAFPNTDDNGRSPEADEVLYYLCAPNTNVDSRIMVRNEIDGVVRNRLCIDTRVMMKRYREISTVASDRLFAIPGDKRILANLVWPLRNAIGCYMVGNYLGTIGICGMVAEMLAILKFEITLRTSDADSRKRISVKCSSRQKFESYGQQDRIRILLEIDAINEKMKDNFDLISRKRARYLHYYSQNHSRIAADAKQTFDSVVVLAVHMIGPEIVDRKIAFKDDITKYLEQKKIIRPSE